MKNLEIKIMNVKQKLIGFGKQFFSDETGMGTVEVILIIVVLVGLVIIFKSQITAIIANLFNKITTQTGTV